jgi:hypothetical protein
MPARPTRREFLEGAALLAAATVLPAAVRTPAASAGTRPYRAFTAGSYWNTPIPASAPIDSRSDRWITWLANNNPTPDVMAGGHDGWAHPIYFAHDTDPLVTMSPTKYLTSMRVRFRLPRDAKPSTGSDSEMSIIDRTTNQDVHLHGFARRSDGTPTCQGMARYWLNSNGLADAAGGPKGNIGHRGVPGYEHGFRKAEIAAGAIRRRLKFSIPQTAGQHYWPMTQDQGHTGVIPEGVVMRIKPGIDVASRVSGGCLVLARACQRYGILVGDSSGNRTTIKGQADVDWTKFGMPGDYHALRAFPIARDWQFVKAGFRP